MTHFSPSRRGLFGLALGAVAAPFTPKPVKALPTHADYHQTRDAVLIPGTITSITITSGGYASAPVVTSTSEPR